ncbi:MAG: hypothetical protein J0I00_10385 [Burkholderiales bacterium]|nr:hypothetical protein [Burkholderiales bacterium]
MAGEIIPARENAPRKLAFTPIQPWTPPKMTNTEARRLIGELQCWVEQFNHPDARKLGEALDDVERLFIRVWTEIDEALSQLIHADYLESKGHHAAAIEARKFAMDYMHRWQDRGGKIGNAG